MLVELSSVHPGGATFLRNSVYRNMDFEAASTFRREAEIALRLPNATSDSPRDVYLFEKTYNMPSVIERPDEGDDQGGDEPYEREGRRRSVAELAAFATSRGKRLDLAQIARWTPTYIVQAYHDTGRITTLFDENKRRILRPQTSFGYFMMHEGSLYGWQHHIEGAELIADNWYMLGVPENGAQRITTAIEAVEGIDDRGDETPGCLGALLILVRALWRAAGQLVRAIRQRLGGP